MHEMNCANCMRKMTCEEHLFTENTTQKLLAFSSFGFSIAHFCFSLRFDASDIRFHISGHTLSGLEVVCFLVGLPRTMYIGQGALSFNKMNLVKPVHASDNSLSINVPICFSDITSKVVSVVLVTSI